MMSPNAQSQLDRTIIGVASSWSAMSSGLNSDQAGVTIIDGNHRGISFVLNENESRIAHSNSVTLFLGIDKNLLVNGREIFGVVEKEVINEVVRGFVC